MLESPSLPRPTDGLYQLEQDTRQFPTPIMADVEAPTSGAAVEVLPAAAEASNPASVSELTTADPPTPIKTSDSTADTDTEVAGSTQAASEVVGEVANDSAEAAPKVPTAVNGTAKGELLFKCAFAYD